MHLLFASQLHVSQVFSAKRSKFDFRISRFNFRNYFDFRDSISEASSIFEIRDLISEVSLIFDFRYYM